MKKVLFIIIVLVALISYNVLLSIIGYNHLTEEGRYRNYCETDSISVGYQFTILQNEDGSFQTVSILNPVYKVELNEYKGLIFAKANTIVNPKGYWHFVKINSKDLPEEPLKFTELKTTRKPSFEGFHEWKKNKPNKLPLSKTKIK